MKFGIEFIVGRVHLSVASPKPVVQRLSHRFNPGGFSAREIVGFANVIPKIEKFDPIIFIMFDQFPIAIANRPSRLPALVGVMRKMPKKLTFWNRSTLKQ